VWLIVAGAGLFAAFPGWYATLFSGFYLAIVLLLVALILRGVSFEFRGKRESPRWRATWDTSLTVGSLLAPFLLAVAFANMLRGVPIDKNQEFSGTFLDLLNPYALFTGASVVLLCILHGATFLALKTNGDVRERAVHAARRVGPITALAVLVFALWTRVIDAGGLVLGAAQIAAVVLVLAAVWFIAQGHEGWAFVATTIAMATTILSIFVDLYPRVMVSSTNPAFSLTVRNASSSPYALKVLTIVAAILFPVVLLYQSWTYYVFRRRVGREDIGGPRSPVDLLSKGERSSADEPAVD
jgi:cytochrome d ubiquinol oxidase subunit II